MKKKVKKFRDTVPLGDTEVMMLKLYSFMIYNLELYCSVQVRCVSSQVQYTVCAILFNRN
jgi:hypothetical protein